MEQNIGILFVVIGSLSASIGILEKNYMFGIDRSVDKFNKKYNVNIDIRSSIFFIWNKRFENDNNNDGYIFDYWLNFIQCKEKEVYKGT